MGKQQERRNLSRSAKKISRGRPVWETGSVQNDCGDGTVWGRRTISISALGHSQGESMGQVLTGGVGRATVFHLSTTDWCRARKIGCRFG